MRIAHCSQGQDAAERVQPPAPRMVVALRAVRLELAVEPFEDSLRATNSAMIHPEVFQMTTAFGGLELKVSVSFFILMLMSYTRLAARILESLLLCLEEVPTT